MHVSCETEVLCQEGVSRLSGTDLAAVGNTCANTTACSLKAALGIELTVFWGVRYKNT